MEKKMIVSDIDGTLLPQGAACVPQRVLNALQMAADQGHTVVIASGRMYSDIPEELRELPGIRYYISCNGASIMDKKTGKRIYSKGLSENLAADLMRHLNQFHCYSSAYLADGPYNWAEMPEEMASFFPRRIEFFSRNRQLDLPAYLEERGEPIEKIYVAVFDQDEKALIRRELSKFHGIHVTSSAKWNIEINHIECDKGAAMSWLARELDVPHEDLIAMGDNENDYTMLSVAGTAVVPANCVDVVRQMASVITPACQQCGMAVYLEQNILERET